jgi:hypothetical protein
MGVPVNMSVHDARVGTRHGGLLAASFIGITARGAGRYLWQCDCGGLTERDYHQVLRCKTPGCSDCRSERISAWRMGNGGPVTHGHAAGGKKTGLYNSWKGMRGRCSERSHKGWRYYGGKGIAVCPEWRDSFEVFRDWALANGYEPGLTIERRDAAKNYEPSNCEWLTRSQNSRNARTDEKRRRMAEALLGAD